MIKSCKLVWVQVVQMFQNFVKKDGILKVIGISEKQESKGRPAGLNTVKLLKVIICCPFFTIAWIIFPFLLRIVNLIFQTICLRNSSTAELMGVL